MDVMFDDANRITQTDGGVDCSFYQECKQQPYTCCEDLHHGEHGIFGLSPMDICCYCKGGGYINLDETVPFIIETLWL